MSSSEADLESWLDSLVIETSEPITSSSVKVLRGKLSEEKKVRLAEDRARESDGFWVCYTCHELKSYSEYFKRSADGRPTKCKSCQKEYDKIYSENNKEVISKNSKERYLTRKETIEPKEWTYANWAINLKSMYSITVEQYDYMLKLQNGVCGICKNLEKSGIRLAVDHDKRCCPGKKSCGKCVRGLLCRACNIHLGYFELHKEMISWIIRPYFVRTNV